MRSPAANLAIHTRAAAALVVVAQPAPTVTRQHAVATQVNELPLAGCCCQLPAEAATASTAEGGHSAQDAAAAGRGCPGGRHQESPARVLPAAGGGTKLFLL